MPRFKCSAPAATTTWTHTSWTVKLKRNKPIAPINRVKRFFDQIDRTDYIEFSLFPFAPFSFFLLENLFFCTCVCVCEFVYWIQCLRIEPSNALSLQRVSRFVQFASLAIWFFFSFVRFILVHRLLLAHFIRLLTSIGVLQTNASWVPFFSLFSSFLFISDSIFI